MSQSGSMHSQSPRSQMVHLREHELKCQQSRENYRRIGCFILFATHRPINELIIREHKQQIRGAEQQKKIYVKHPINEKAAAFSSIKNKYYMQRADRFGVCWCWLRCD